MDVTPGTTGVSEDDIDDITVSDADITADELSGGDQIRVVWTSPSGGTSNTIGQSTVPS